MFFFVKLNVVFLSLNHCAIIYVGNNNKSDKKQKNFSTKVADDISQFIALFDRGLIPISFYPYSFKTQSIVNFSGFNESAIEEDVIITPIFFKLASIKQAFHPLTNVPYLGEHIIKKGFSFESYLDQMTKNPFFKANILCTKVAGDISYEYLKNGKVIPRLTFSIFLNQQNN